MKSDKIFLYTLVHFVTVCLTVGIVSCHPQHSPINFHDFKRQEQNNEIRDRLKTILTQLVYFDSEISHFSQTFAIGPGFYGVDENGSLYFENFLTHIRIELAVNFKNQEPNIHYELTLMDGGPLPSAFPLPTQKVLNTLALLQRSRAIFLLKTRYPDYYFQTVQQRLNPNPYEQLLALERDENARPLVFKNDDQWNEFKQDLISLFSVFVQNVPGYIVLLGSSTSYYSKNPTKGTNAALLLLPTVANVYSEQIHTFDIPGKERSDVDINLLIPALSALCYRAEPSLYGNCNDRVVYEENSIEKCLWKSKDPRILAMVKKKTDLLDPSLSFHDKYGQVKMFRTIADLSSYPQAMLKENKLFYTMTGDFLSFILKWNQKLGGRDISFNSRILPTFMKDRTNPKYRSGVADFENDSSLQSRFMIEVH